MWDLNDVESIQYQSNYCYKIVFDDGTNAVIDFEEYLAKGPVFAPLRDLDLFKRAFVWCRDVLAEPSLAERIEVS